MEKCSWPRQGDKGGTPTVCCSFFSSSEALRATSCGVFGWKFGFMGMTQCLGLQSLVFPQRMEGKSYDSRHLFNLGSCFSFFLITSPSSWIFLVTYQFYKLQQRWLTTVTGWLTRYFLWCSSDSHVMGVTIYFLIGSKACCLKQNLYLAPLKGQEPVAR